RPRPARRQARRLRRPPALGDGRHEGMARRAHPQARPMSSPPVGHSHRLPPWLFAGLAVMVLGLVGSLVLVAQQAIATNNRLTALEQYVAGKGQARDQENTRLNERIDQAVCSVL